MTSRLKRKLNDLGVDTSGSKATENFCLIGTPLPPLEKSKDTGEFVPLWKQDVRDEKGRRRLHGAFTGGFSAGYFNTVGSKEGWAPSEFRSSRVERAKKKAARPEDFMDEEDLRELRDSQKLVDTTEEMDLDFWQRKATGNGEEKGEIENALAAVLLPAPRDSVGAQILKKMGWRIGHGIGPKVTYEQRKRQDALFHGLTGSEGALPEPEDHEEATKHLYPPRDTKVPVFKRKDDKHGLGYESGPGLSQLVATEISAKDRSTSGQGPKISVGFGLGALNDADEDDLDVYDGGPSQTSRRLAYDADEDDEKNMMRKTTRTPRNAPISASRSYFSNGSPCLPGFVVADKPVSEENLFPPPVVPKDWASDPRRVWGQDKENFRVDSDTQDVARQTSPKDGQAWRRSELSANQRGNLLGEAPLPAAPRSVFDYLKPKDRDRLKNVSTGHAQKDASISEDSQRDSGPTVPEQAPNVPPLDPQVAKMALQGFQPFTNDPIKQTRYTAYLQAQAAGEDSVPFSRMPGQAADAFMRELEDYARSARIFKPVSGAMAGRFTRAAVMDTSAQTAGGLHRPTEEGSYLSMPGETEKEAEPEKEESPKENAARLGMYGPLTREVKPWIPARLLCKRFGVKEPEVELPSEAEASGVASGKDNWQKDGVLPIAEATEAGFTGSTRIGENGTANENGSTDISNTPGRRDIGNIGLGDEDETQGQDILTYERPGMDIFKAIFASDEEDAGQDEENTEDNDAVGHKSGAPSQTDGILTAAPGSEIADSDAGPSHVAPVDYNNMAGKVDISEFKPTFVLRSDRAKVKDKDKRDKGKDRGKEKKKKKKKHRSALVSFEVEEESGDREQIRERGSEKRKKKNSEKNEDISRSDDADDEGMWIEKPPPETVQNFVATTSVPVPSAAAEEHIEAGPPRGRKRAVDFL
ncbi:hypothetical protein ACEPAI_3780 [Sanghuangporus weigelae]